MGKIAFVFSGQGAQHPGMGEDLYNEYASVKALFDGAEARRPGTLAQMFKGDAETLRETENTQPCLYLADLAPALVLSEAGVVPSGAAGFSLGELPALAFAGAIGHLDGFSLTCRRGAVMGEATHERNTAMAAVVKLENSEVEAVCREFAEVYPVNYNSPGQLVVAGAAEAMPEFCEKIKARGGRAIPLAVAGGFHSPFMDGAACKFEKIIRETGLSSPAIPVYANCTAEPYSGPTEDTLSRQMNHPVLWEKTVRRMAADGFDTFIETGVGVTLSKLITKILPEAKVYSAETAEGCRKIIGEAEPYVHA